MPRKTFGLRGRKEHEAGKNYIIIFIHFTDNIGESHNDFALFSVKHTLCRKGFGIRVLVLNEMHVFYIWLNA